MSLLQQVKTTQLQARKNRDTASAAILTTLIGEAEAIGKNEGNRTTTDLEVVAMVKKFIKNLDEVVSLTSPESIAHQNALDEKKLLTQFLPKQLSQDELSQVLVDLTTELNAHAPKDMGRIMKLLKERFDGQYDGGLASTLIKGILK